MVEQHLDIMYFSGLIRFVGSDQFEIVRSNILDDLNRHERTLEKIVSEAHYSDSDRLHHKLSGFAKQFGFRKLMGYLDLGFKKSCELTPSVAEQCQDEIARLKIIVANIDLFISDHPHDDRRYISE